MIARVHASGDGKFWLFHKQLIDDNIDTILDNKPEEKIWIIVSQNYTQDFEFPAYRLKKNDLFKVGRVRFKVREVVSPIYN